MAGGFNPDEYNTVAERLIAFYDKFPDGSIQSEVLELTEKRVVMRGIAYRSKDDDKPGIGTSAMPIPATNAMLRNSEIETAETSAWGRAIAALGFEVRKAVATKDEVDNKRVTVETPEPPVIGTDGLIGTVELGKRPVDLNLRETPEGPAWGFKLKDGNKSYQVLARGPLADAIGLALVGEPDLIGQRVQVWGSVEMIPWEKGGRQMTPYPRVHLTKIKTPSFTLPAEVSPLRDPEQDVIPVAEGQVGFDLVESARLDAEEAARTA